MHASLSVFQTAFNEKDTYYIFNHVDIEIEYHLVPKEDWGANSFEDAARLISAKLTPRRYKARQLIENVCVY
jgi:transmembrane 9 superfamily protein 2/4